jgi:capsular exopolysaccharide synthesis family protein
MSRIHEALKKAEQERAAVQPVDVVAVLQREGETAPGRGNGASTISSAVVSQAATVVSRPGDSLRFADLRARCAHPQWHLDPNMNVFLNSGMGAHASEQFRTLRSRLYQLRGDQPLRTLLVTSSFPTEGKTFVTNNLAQAIVHQLDRRVLLVDADLRRPRLHLPLGAPFAPGLTDYLAGKAEESAIIQHGQEGNLCFIAGGNEVTNPSELLSNGRLKTLLDHIAPVFDWVLVDSPPCLLVADASVLADICDGVLLVVRAGSTPSEAAQRTCQELQGRRILGVVLNAVEETHAYGAYYSNGYTYGDGHSGPKGSRN